MARRVAKDLQKLSEERSRRPVSVGMVGPLARPAPPPGYSDEEITEAIILNRYEKPAWVPSHAPGGGMSQAAKGEGGRLQAGGGTPTVVTRASL
jgi:hypothetical protein